MEAGFEEAVKAEMDRLFKEKVEAEALKRLEKLEMKEMVRRAIAKAPQHKAE